MHSFSSLWARNKVAYIKNERLEIKQTETNKHKGEGRRNRKAEEMTEEKRAWTKWNQTLCLLFPQAVHASASINLHVDKKKTNGCTLPLFPAPSSACAAEVGNGSRATQIRSQQGSLHLAGCSWRAD